MADKLDIRPLERAIASLDAVLSRAARTPQDDVVGDACIQRFEYTYELSHKMLRRFLERASASPDEVHAMAFADLIRTGSDQGLLLGDWPRWRDYRDKRSATSHTYVERKAREVFAILPEFLREARYLSERLSERLSHEPDA